MVIKSDYETMQAHMASPEFQERLQRDIELTDRVKAGYTPPERTEENTRPAILDGQFDEDARDALGQLSESYKGLIYQRAFKLYNKLAWQPSIEEDDLAQEGFSAICLASLAWDPDKSRGGFTSYLREYIDQRMNRYIYNCISTIRVPVGQRLAIARYLQAQWSIYGSEEHVPSRKRLAEIFGVSVEEIDELAIANALTGQMGSLEGGFFEDNRDGHSTFGRGEGEWHDPNPEVQKPISTEEEVVLSALKDVVASIFDTNLNGKLRDREVEVLKLRFFGVEGEPLTLEEIGKMLGVTRERVRQIESKALAKLRRPGVRDKLELFLVK